LRIQQPQKLRKPPPQILRAYQKWFSTRRPRLNETNARPRGQRRKKLGSLFCVENELMFKFQHAQDTPEPLNARTLIKFDRT
jgi:hypothetical protein